jgi:hypothetical protein
MERYELANMRLVLYDEHPSIVAVSFHSCARVALFVRSV